LSVRSWGIYSTESGHFRAAYTGPEDTIQEQLREGEAAIEGEFDGARQRVNPKSLEVEYVQPAPPGPGHLWDGWRWIPDPVAMEAVALKQRALAKIEELEASQARPLREYVLGLPGSKEKLTQIEGEIAQLRSELRIDVSIEVPAEDSAKRS